MNNLLAAHGPEINEQIHPSEPYRRIQAFMVRADQYVFDECNRRTPAQQPAAPAPHAPTPGPSTQPQTPHTPRNVRNISPGDLYPGGKDISIVQPPPLSTPTLPISTIGPTVLPLELVQRALELFWIMMAYGNPNKSHPDSRSDQDDDAMSHLGIW